MSAPVYPSKVDAWLVAVVAAAFAFTLYGGFSASPADRGEPYASLGLAAFIVALIVALAWPCRYVLEPEHLLIASGLFFRQRIPYRQITGVEPSANPLAAPALSLRRVKVSYGSRYQLVSPRDRDGFMRALRARADLARAQCPPPRRSSE
jgi:membrane protein YdbS with pleckstrin-like domain